MTMVYHETGPTDAPTIVFLHGGGAGSWSWRKIIQGLQGEFHCLAPDLPGSAASPDPLFMFDGAADQVAELIRSHARGGKAHLVGLSLGGQLGTVMLSRHSDLLHSAILSGTLAREVPGLGCMTTPFGKSLLRATLMAYWPFRNQSFWIRANMKSYGIPAEFEPEVRAETQSFTIDGFMQMVSNENMGFRLPTGLEKANLPVLIVAGQKEYRVIFDSARDLRAALPQAQARVAIGVGHNWSLENPDLFARMVRAWVTGGTLPLELQPLP